MKHPSEQPISRILHQNIQALLQYRKSQESKQSTPDRIALWFNALIGNMTFVYAHLSLVAFWIVYNTVLPFPPYDPYPFGALSAFVSVESIFLGTFILIGQNRMNDLSERRADLAVQINLLAEHELTQLIRIVDALARKMNVRSEDLVDDVAELKRDVPPEAVLKKIEEEEENGERGE